jgi:hypothetical protein
MWRGISSDHLTEKYCDREQPWKVPNYYAA